MKIFIFISIFISLLQAHPHTFIEIYPNIIVKDKVAKKINFTWKLDEMTSSMLIMESDENVNNKIDKEEQQYIFESFFSTLIDYNYYTDITINEKIMAFPNTSNFHAYIENNKLCFNFEINDNLKIENLVLDFGDKDFFVAMILKKEFITISGANAIVSDLDNDFYFGYRLELQ